MLMLTLYVDDMLIAGHCLKDNSDLKSKLHSQFDMKDLGDVNCILGMRMKRGCSNKLLYLSQKEYVHKVLEHFNMQQGKSCSTTFPIYLKLNKDDCPQSDEEKDEMAKIPYASACGSLMYVVVPTRLDTAFVVGVVIRYMSNPRKKPWEAIKPILKYLSGTTN